MGIVNESYHLVVVHPMLACVDLLWRIVVRALFMGVFVLVAVRVVTVFLREPVRVKFAFAGDDG